MSVFSVVSDAQSGLFRMQQAKKPWEKELEAKDAQGQLAQKAERAQGLSQPLAKWQSDQASARAALEEARRVGGPKAAAAARLEQVERRIEELKLAMRFAHGDPQKLASLAREAALLAREAGRAAKEYGGGIAAAAELGLPGDSAAASGGGAGGGAVGTSETSITRTTSSLTVQQTEVTLTIGISTGEGASAESAAASSAAASADQMAATAGAEADSPAGGEAAAKDGLPPEIAKLVDGVLSGLGGNGLTGNGLTTGGAGQGTASSGGGASMIQRMMTGNGLAMSRYREADSFGQRVEAVLATSKSIIGEAKAANMLDPSEKKRRERREGFKADDKMVDAAQKEVNALRSAAFGSSAAPGGVDGTDGAAGAGTGGPTDAPASLQAAPSASPVVNMLA